MLTPTQKKDFRAVLVDYFHRAEAHRLAWMYSRRRPYTGLGVVPEANHVADCSSYAALAFYWAMHKTGIHVTDPLHEQFSGYGSTGTAITYLKAHPTPVDKYLVGDLAFFGPSVSDTVHMSICEHPGTAHTSLFSSNGHQSWIFGEDAPEPISLSDEKFRQHLIGVYRHPALL